MPPQTALPIHQTPAGKGRHAIRLTLRRAGQADVGRVRPTSAGRTSGPWSWGGFGHAVCSTCGSVAASFYHRSDAPENGPTGAHGSVTACLVDLLRVSCYNPCRALA